MLLWLERAWATFSSKNGFKNEDVYNASAKRIFSAGVEGKRCRRPGPALYTRQSPIEQALFGKNVKQTLYSPLARLAPDYWRAFLCGATPCTIRPLS